MKHHIVFALLFSIGPTCSAVVFSDAPQFVNPRIGLIEFDLDRNGTSDLGFGAVGGSYPALYVTGSITTAIAYSIHPVWGGRVAALEAGESLDSFGNRPLFAYTQLTPGAKFLLSKPPPDDAQPGDYAPFFEKTAYLGFSFQGDDGLHYGYALLEVVGASANITKIAYESDPDTAIITGAVPEPSGATLILLSCAGFAWRRSRKEVSPD